MTKETNQQPTETIVITRNGNTVAAMYNGHVGEKGTMNVQTATCNPKDEFSLYEGARIALARLFGKDPFPYPDGGFKENDLAIDNGGDVFRIRKITDPIRMAEVVPLKEKSIFDTVYRFSPFDFGYQIPITKITKLVKEEKE